MAGELQVSRVGAFEVRRKTETCWWQRLYSQTKSHHCKALGVTNRSITSFFFFLGLQFMCNEMYFVVNQEDRDGQDDSGSAELEFLGHNNVF